MRIETFIIFDIETTGLPQLEKNRTKITELTFLAVSRNDIESANCKLPPMSKLSLLFNPQRPIQTGAANVTGLTNEFLKNQPEFIHKINCINAFLDLPKPVCLIAHNGNAFDFKILKAEYYDANTALPDDLMCVDSLRAFKQILKNDCSGIKYNTTHLNDTLENEWPELDITPEDWQEIDRLTNSFSHMSSTPKKQKPIDNYRLSTLYSALVKAEPTGAHRAEGDCLMLLECILQRKLEFLQWADSNYKKIGEIKPLCRK